jgi:beta-N-acetylhexosaminidase
MQKDAPAFLSTRRRKSVMDYKESFLKNITEKMSLEQKVGSVLTLAFNGTFIRNFHRQIVQDYQCGGLRCTPIARCASGQYVDPKTKEVIFEVKADLHLKKGTSAPHATASQYSKLLNELQSLAMARSGGIPLHFSLDQEGGNGGNFSFGGVNVFPPQMGLRASNDPGLSYEVGFAKARQLRAAGFNQLHAPVLDINVNPLNPEISTRSFSDKVEDVILYGGEYCRGLKQGGIIATGKHCPGRGDSDVDAHFEIPVIDVPKETLLDRELLPYKVLGEQGLLPSIMLAHSIYPALDEEHVATVSKRIVTDILREKIGYEGVITTDSMTMGGITKRYGLADACAMSLLAGVDLVLMKADNHWSFDCYDKIKEYVESGKLSIEDLDKKIYRILSMKYDYKLFHHANEMHETIDEVIHDPQVIRVTHEAAKRSIFVARDDASALPLPTDQKTLVIEQAQEWHNDFHYHSCMLWENCTHYNPDAKIVEVSFEPDEEDLDLIHEVIGDYSHIVITSYFARGSLPVKDYVQKVIDAYPDKTFVVVADNPYPLGIPDRASTVVVNLSEGTPKGSEMTAGVLYGKINPEGICPV